MNSRLQVKIRTGDSIRRYSFDKPPSWQAFIEHLTTHLYPEACFPGVLPFKVEYKDDEDDLVTIDSEEEWQEMLKYKISNLVTLFIKELPVNILDGLKRQEELKKQEEDLKRQQLEEEEIKRKEEEERRREEELKKQKEREEEEELRRKQEEELKKQEEEKYLLYLEKLKLMDKEIEEIEKEKKEKKAKIPPAPPSEAVSTTTNNNNNNNNSNNYIKLYAQKLQIPYEAGFLNIERNLYLLITFNGNIDTVIDKLLQTQ